MARFLPCDYAQSTMVAVNYEDQLQAGTFEHALHYLIEKRLDLSAFEADYANEDTGRPAYPPSVMLKIVLFAYSKGMTSSRAIQWQCRTNIIFQALACGCEPHWTSLAAFISGHREAVRALFEQVLLVCHEEGLLGNTLFAIDGCKMSSNAAKEWSGTMAELEKKRGKLQRHLDHFMSEQAKHDRAGVGAEALAARAAQSVETLNRAVEKVERFLADAEPRMGKGRQKREVKSNITDNESAKMTTSKGTIQGYTGVATVDERHQVIVDAQAFGEGQEQHTLQPMLDTLKTRYQRLNMSENIFTDGAVVTADTGFASEANMKHLYEQGIDGYIPDNQFRRRDARFNEQRADKSRQKPRYKRTTPETFPSSEFDFDPIGRTCSCPAGKQLRLDSERVDRDGHNRLHFQGRLRDCRDCPLKVRCMRRPEAADHRHGKGRQVSFIIERRGQPSYTDGMKQRVDSARGREIYSQRLAVVEPVFANIGTQKGLRRFSLRGSKKVDAQWKMFAIVHNLGKLHRYGALAA